MLSASERAFLSSVRLAKRRREYIAGRFAARTLAAGMMGVRPEEVALVVRDDGSPAIEGARFNISIAHTRSVACAAIAAGIPVGIDVEEIKKRDPDLFRFVLHEAEYDLLETLPVDRDRTLILCWTLKEAVLKGMRTGFRCSPKTLRLSIAFEARTAQIIVPEQPVWTARFEERDGCYLSIAFPHT